MTKIFKFKFILVLLVLLSLFFSSNFSADKKHVLAEESLINLSGKIYGSDTKKGLPDTNIYFSANEPTFNTPDVKTVTTNSDGFFSLALDPKIYNQIYIEKDNYKSLQGTMALSKENPDLNFSLVLDPGPGIDMVHLQSIVNGWQMISTPLAPIEKDPSKFFAYYKQEGDSYTEKYLDVHGNLDRFDLEQNGYVAYSQMDSGRFGEIKQRDSYWLLQLNQESKVVVEKGIPPQSGENIVNFSKLGWQMLGFPMIKAKKISEFSVEFEGNKYTLEEAVDNQHIQTLCWYDNESRGNKCWSPDFNFDAVAVPGQAFWVSAKEGVKLNFGQNEDLNSDATVVNLPANISLLDAQWTFWVDKNTLNEEGVAVWQYLSEEIANVTMAEMGESDTTSYSKSAIVYKKDEVVIRQSPPENMTPEEMDTRTRATVEKYISDLNSYYRNSPSCVDKPDMRICVRFLTTGNVSDDTRLHYKDEVSGVYDIIESIYGPPLADPDPYILEPKRFLSILVSANPQSEESTGKFMSPFDTISWTRSGEYEGELNKASETVLVHEMVHAFHGKKQLQTYWSGYASWEEGFAHYIAPGLFGEGDSIHDSVKEFYSDYNQPIMTTINQGAWRNWAQIFRYELASYAFDQLYAENHNFFKEFNTELAKTKPPIFPGYAAFPNKKTPMDILKKVTHGKAGMKLVNGNPVDQSLGEWYKKQYGLVQEKMWWDGHKFVPYVFPTGDPGSGAYLVRWNEAGDISKMGFYIKNRIYKTDTIDGKGGTRLVRPSGGYQTNTPDGSLYTFAPSDSNAKGHKYTIASDVNTGYLKELNNDYREYPVNTYTAQPTDDAGIFGVVGERGNTGSVDITPLKPDPLPVKTIPIHDGYFETSKSGNPHYGWNEGTYRITYRTVCGTTRDFFITKTQGRKFLSIRTGDSTHVTKAAADKSFVSKIASILPKTSIANAEETAACFLPGLEILEGSTNKELQGSGAVIKGSANRPAFIDMKYGETTEYGQAAEAEEVRPTTDDFDTPSKISISNLLSDKTYHFKLRLVEATSEELPDGLAVTSETEDQTLTVFDYSNLQNIGKLNSADISFKTSAATKTEIEYGKTDTYGQKKDIAATLKTDHSITIDSLEKDTTYYYRLKATAENGTFRYQTGTFRTSEELKIISKGAGWAGDYKANINFSTNISATAKLFWGKTTEYGNTKSFDTAATNFNYQFDADENQQYYYKIIATSGNGQSIEATGGFLTPGITTSIHVYEKPTSYEISWQTDMDTSGTIRYTKLLSGANAENPISGESAEVAETTPYGKTHLVTINKILLESDSLGYRLTVIAKGRSGKTVELPMNQGLNPYFFTSVGPQSYSIGRAIYSISTKGEADVTVNFSGSTSGSKSCHTTPVYFGNSIMYWYCSVDLWPINQYETYQSTISALQPVATYKNNPIIRYGTLSMYIYPRSLPNTVEPVSIQTVESAKTGIVSQGLNFQKLGKNNGQKYNIFNYLRASGLYF